MKRLFLIFYLTNFFTLRLLLGSSEVRLIDLPKFELGSVPKEFSSRPYPYKVFMKIENPSQKAQPGGGRNAYISEEVPLARVPQSTLRACNWLILQKFFASPGPGQYGDRFYDVTPDNAHNHVYFRLTFMKPLKSTGTFDSTPTHPNPTWVLTLSAEGVHGGKPAMLGTYYLDTEGKIKPSSKDESTEKSRRSES